MLVEMPFAIARVQTDRGREFISREFIRSLRRLRVKLRPNRAGAPHLNGKVERSRQTDRIEFYALEISGKGKGRRVRNSQGLHERPAQWQAFYNHQRAPSSLGGRRPWQRWEEVCGKTPSREELDRHYDGSSEPTRVKRGHWQWVSAGR
ncbi:MAG: hypothetical protein RhofKO_34900 [Rhodothermales bacterium]